MSGCVNCVWDAYREEVEAWAARRRAAAKLAQGGGEEEEMERKKARELRGRGRRMVGGSGSAAGGNGSIGDVDEPVGSGVELDDERSLFEGVPVGIREFMATEKKLRERKEKEEQGEREKG
ncbi:MAG: hypothetical protein L6R39_006612 [Caloplaca ligustica]|nr:MAG: hypothetical protein L6R39_006612 [Caloplaca ligustica]